MAIFSCLYKKRSLLQHLKKYAIIYINQKNNSTQNFTKAIIKDNCIYSPFSNVPINNKDNLFTFLWSNKSNMMDNTALVCSVTDRSYTYGELKILSQNFGSALLDHGIKPGQVVAVIFKNFIEMPVVLMSAISAGFTVCSINPDYTSDEMKHQLINSGAVTVVTYLNNLPNVEEAVSKLDRPIKIIVIPGVEVVEEQLNCNKCDIIYENLIKESISKSQQLNPKSKSEDLFHISHSSGTTGLPKGIWLSHGNFINNIVQLTSIPNFSLLKFAKENHQEVVPFILPLFHNFALAMFFVSLYVGSKIILIPKFEKGTFINTLEKYQTTTVFAVPSLVQYLIDSTEANSRLVKCLENIYCGGAPFTIPDFHNVFTNKFPYTKFRLGWGLSEGTCFVTLNPPDTKRVVSSGIPIPNAQIKIIDLETGKNNSPNCKGEICFKGPQMCKGYLNNPKATAECIDSEGWFHTGDIGYYDTDGFLFVVDRLKDMIKVKGFQVSPAELEELLKSHESVEDAAVVGYPHPKKGEAPAAFIIPNNNELDKVQLGEVLKKFIQSKVATFKQIEKVIFVNEIPKSLSGKILKRQLRPLIKSEK